MRSLWASLIASFLLSLLSTWAVLAWVEERIPLLGSFVGLQKSLNPGIAFGIRLPAVVLPFAIVLSLLLILWVGLKTAKGPLEQTGFGFIVGGGAANVIDRIGDGLVTDVFQVGSFPVFNMADSFISVGVGLLAVSYVWGANARRMTNSQNPMPNE